ncbi:LOW QUALITY PROTEIN: uncharacterized protein LOC109841819 [Asparagus officinalis]|uniref:LOW QUALITY PROTEIN: uncharacterized protein LOC109841819 n=1 Tax=Asparagus officinalis TaxID=4686 RepID=UPI00098E2CBF|nr:LOW QUALITY PROTEIN: uncharacterized protein LOC109841819 [Asparagus officinalis]
MRETINPPNFGPRSRTQENVESPPPPPTFLTPPATPKRLTLTLIRSLCSSSPSRHIKQSLTPSSPRTREPQQPTQTRNPDPAPPPRSDRVPPPSFRSWTARDARFVKGALVSISPVAYPSRVAPLPEDRRKEEEAEGDEEVRREGRRIERGEGRVRSYFGLQEEEERIPFPRIIKQEKRPQKVVMELSAAIREVKANAKSKFTETIEAHVNLGVDPRRSDQNVRGSVMLPNGTGKTVRVAVFAEGAAADEAREAGADIVGGDALIEEIKGGGKLNFDKCISTPMFMPRLSKHIAKILGPRGLMPNPKQGSVTSDVAPAVKAAKCGRLDFKSDKTANVHVGLGKVDFSEDALRENIGAFVNALLVAKPVGLKKTSKYVGYVKNFTLTSTMGPGFPITIQSLSIAADNYTKQHAK